LSWEDRDVYLYLALGAIGIGLLFQGLIFNMTVDEPDNPTEEVEVTGNGAFDHFPIFCYILGT